MKKYILSLLIAGFLSVQMFGQFGIGLVGGNDIYHRYQNPDGGSSGNAILNIHLGPKIWVGGDNFSVSVESYMNWGSTSLSLGDYKGMGDVAVPLIGKLNFNGNSGFSSELRSGFSIGGGVQMSRTEWYGVSRIEGNETVIRELFPTFIGEISRGYGIGGFYVELFGRFGWDPNSNASSLNVGLSYNINVVGFKQLKRKLERFDN